jgi:Mg-chelatase subunit ChlD
MKKDYTHITLVLDRSGSMAHMWDETKNTINTFIEEQRKVEGTATFSLVYFDHEYGQGPIMEDINTVSVNWEEINPRGMTSLLDAVGRAVVETGEKLAAMNEEDRPEKVMFVIQTDGQENSSKEYTAKQLKELISEQETKYAWGFIFLGADLSSAQQATQFLSKGQTFSYAGDTQLYGATISRSVSAFRTAKTHDAKMAALNINDPVSN